MTQTPRDWQKDMDRVQSMIKMGAFEEWTEPMLYWLQEYESKKDTAKVYREQALKQMRENREIKDREQRLKETVEWVKRRFEAEWTYEPGIGEVVDEIIHEFDAALNPTLYPDTPAPISEE